MDPKTTSDDWKPPEIELRRSSSEEKEDQINRLQNFHEKNSAYSAQALEELRQTAIRGENIFASLMKATRVASLGQITNTLYSVGGEYRRNL